MNPDVSLASASAGAGTSIPPRKWYHLVYSTRVRVTYLVILLLLILTVWFITHDKCNAESTDVSSPIHAFWSAVDFKYLWCKITWADVVLFCCTVSLVGCLYCTYCKLTLSRQLHVCVGKFMIGCMRGWSLSFEATVFIAFVIVLPLFYVEFVNTIILLFYLALYLVCVTYPATRPQ